MANTDDNNALATTSKPANTKLALGQRLAAMDPALLDEKVATQFAALEALGTNKDTTDMVRKAVEGLVALASPQRPGMEEMNTAWKVPRVNIVQPTSQSEAKPEAAKNGDLYTTAGQLLERPFGIIPIYFHEENINFPKQGKNPVCSSPDAKLGSPFGECLKCQYLPFGKQPGGFDNQKPTDCQNNIVCVALTMDLSQVVVVQFGKTSRKTGAVLLQLAGQQTSVWKQSYTLNTEKKTADVGIYFVYKVEPTAKDNAADVQLLAKTIYGLYAAERERMLADWYRRPMRAPQAAAEAEGNFAAGALEAGLGGDDGAEPDLSTPAPTTTPSGKGSARSSNKPM